jgi:hypothetical protein
MVAVPSETVTPVGLRTLNLTVDPNPFRRFRLIVEIPCPPVLIERLEGFADRLKSWKVNVAVAVWVKLPLVAVSVNPYVEADEDEQETVAVPFAVKLVGDTAPQFSPVGALSVSVTVPVNPWIRAIVIVDFADDPTFTAEGEVATIVKLGGVPNVKAAVA